MSWVGFEQKNFASKNLAGTGIRTRDLCTRVALTLDNRRLNSTSFGGNPKFVPFQVASTLGDLAAASVAIDLVTSKHTQSLYRVGSHCFAYNYSIPGPLFRNSFCPKIFVGAFFLDSFLCQDVRNSPPLFEGGGGGSQVRLWYPQWPGKVSEEVIGLSGNT